MGLGASTSRRSQLNRAEERRDVRAGNVGWTKDESDMAKNAMNNKPRRDGAAHASRNRWRRRSRLNLLWATAAAITLLLAHLGTAGAALFYPGLPPDGTSSAFSCLDGSSQRDGLLMFVPFAINATFDRTSPAYTLNLTVYGNVTGRLYDPVLPPPSDLDYWNNPNKTNGKIPDQDPSSGKQTTLFTYIDVLNYSPYKSDPMRFCNYTGNTHCPLVPHFEEM